jgi:hypothetical protein
VTGPGRAVLQMTPEEREGQLANQRRLEELIERRLAEERERPADEPAPEKR